jgi:hypothetical protein
MNNKVIGAVIAFLYFANYHICKLLHNGDVEFFWYLKNSIYCIIILLAIEYKKKDTFLEKLFCAIIFNNIYVLLFRNETGYTLNDIIFIASFTAIQYVKYLYNLYKQWLNNY